MRAWESWGTGGGTKLSRHPALKVSVWDEPKGNPSVPAPRILCLDLNSDLQLVQGWRAGSKPGFGHLWGDPRSGVKAVA